MTKKSLLFPIFLRELELELETLTHHLNYLQIIYLNFFVHLFFDLLFFRFFFFQPSLKLQTEVDNNVELSLATCKLPLSRVQQ